MPYKKTAAFYLQPGVLDITGDFLIALNDKVYLVKNFQFDIPISGTYQPDGGGQPIVQTNVIGMSWDTTCQNDVAAPSPLQPGDPPPADATQTPID